MTRKRIDAGDLSFHLMRNAENIYWIAARNDEVPQGMLRAITHEKDEVARITEIVTQVMPNAPRLRHTRGTDDNARLVQFIELLRLRGLANVEKMIHAKGVAFGPQVLIGLRVKALRMQAKDLRRVHAQRAVHEDRHLGQTARLGQLIQDIDQLLGSPHRKGRNDHLTPSGQSARDHPTQFISRKGRIAVFPITVGAFDLKKIHTFYRLGIAKNFLIGAANVSTEEKPELPSPFPHVQNDLRRTQNMPGIPKLQSHSIDQRHATAIIDGHELSGRLLCILNRVERFHRRQPLLGPLPGHVLTVSQLNPRRILQHHRAEIASGECRVYVPLVTLPAQVG